MPEGLTVSVGYADELRRILPLWRNICSRIVVATDMSDDATVAVCSGLADVYRTKRFYEGGASFNKGGAMELVRTRLSADDWVVVFDADIIPPASIDFSGLTPGNLYGAPRRYEDGRLIREGGFPGYFWIFHGTDPALGREWFTSWKHAGCYDSEFEKKWPRDKKIKLPFNVTHIGEHGQNWWGRGNLAGMKKMQDERNRLRSYQHERVV
jgi:hypothetical protein